MSLATLPHCTERLTRCILNPFSTKVGHRWKWEICTPLKKLLQCNCTWESGWRLLEVEKHVWDAGHRTCDGENGFPLSSKSWLCIYLPFICSYKHGIVKVGKGL